MNKSRTEFTLLSHVFLLLSGLMLIIMTISVSSYSYGFSACANQRGDNSITTSCHRERYSSIEDPANIIISELDSNGIIIIGHNATAGVHIVGNVKLSSLPSAVPAASEGQQPHVIPFHPKNLIFFG